MQDDLRVDPDWKSSFIYSPLKSPLSPDSKKYNSESVCTSGLYLCYRQSSDNLINEMPKLPSSGRIAELYQDIRDQANISSNSSPFFSSIKTDNIVPIDDITPDSFFTEEGNILFKIRNASYNTLSQ